MITKEQMLISLALEIIDEEEFILTEEEGRFKLIDTTDSDFGEIEQDRFDTLAEALDRLESYHDDYLLDDIEVESFAARNMQELKENLSLFGRMAYQLLRNAPQDWCEILAEIKLEDLKDWPRNDDGTYSQNVFDDFENDKQNKEFMEQELERSFLQTVAADLTYQKEEEGSEELKEQEEEQEI